MASTTGSSAGGQIRRKSLFLVGLGNRDFPGTKHSVGQLLLFNLFDLFSTTHRYSSASTTSHAALSLHPFLSRTNLARWRERNQNYDSNRGLDVKRKPKVNPIPGRDLGFKISSPLEPFKMDRELGGKVASLELEIPNIVPQSKSKPRHLTDALTNNSSTSTSSSPATTATTLPPSTLPSSTLVPPASGLPSPSVLLTLYFFIPHSPMNLSGPPVLRFYRKYLELDRETRRLSGENEFVSSDYSSSSSSSESESHSSSSTPPISHPHLLILHDHLSLPPGSVSARLGGSHNGHNGVRSVIGSLDGFIPETKRNQVDVTIMKGQKTQKQNGEKGKRKSKDSDKPKETPKLNPAEEFWRFRVGIGRPEDADPVFKGGVAEWVLSELGEVDRECEFEIQEIDVKSKDTPKRISSRNEDLTREEESGSPQTSSMRVPVAGEILTKIWERIVKIGRMNKEDMERMMLF